MSSLDTLIKLHRWQLDEQRRKVAEFESLAAKLRGELQRLDEEEVSEQQVAEDSHEANYAYSGYARGLIDRRNKLMKSVEETEQQIVQARAELADAFAEVKRYEIAAANRLLAKHRGLERLRQQELDEVAVDGFRRKTK
ncbi:MAG TPA: flagellar FliJ family protein [Stellaceae bacterium]|nr:flagellar FliJ family protein [Stellaceae bacterium]